MTPIASLYAAIPICGALVALFSLEQIVNGIRHGFARDGDPVILPNHVVLGIMTALFLGLGYLGVPVAFALIAGVLVGHGADADHLPVDHRAVVQRHRFDGADGHSVLPAGGRADDLGRGDRAHRQSVPGDGGPCARRAGAGDHGVQHVLLRHVRLVHRRCGGAVAHHGAADGDRGLPAGIRRRPDRGGQHHRRPGAAQHHGGGVWRDRQCLHRRAVPGRHRAGVDGGRRADALLLFLRPLRHAPAARQPGPTGRRHQGGGACR